MNAQRTIPLLVGALQDDEYAVRRCAAHALGEFGSASKEAVPMLIEVLKERNSFWQRDHARFVAEALGKIGDPKAVPALCDARKTDYHALQYHANKALEAIGTEDALACVEYADIFRCPVCGEINMFYFCPNVGTYGHYYCEKHAQECGWKQLQDDLQVLPAALQW